MFLPVTGHPLHTRSITLKLAQADNGQWAARGEIIDLRKTGFAPLSTDLQPAGIIHHMTLELGIDPAGLTITRLAAAQPVVAIEPSERSCGESCRDPVGALDALVGEPLDGVFRSKLSAAFGGPRGCSHLLALFQFMDRAIQRAAHSEAAHHDGPSRARRPGEAVFQSSLFVDGYQTPTRQFELTLQLSDYLVRPEVHAGSALERFQYEDAVRVYTLVDTQAMTLAQPQVGIRSRDLDNLAADWRERPDWAQMLEGRPLMRGMGAWVAGAWREQEARQLQDGLAQLAPGFIQILAAVADQWIARTRDDGEAGASEPLGAGVDSCYIWREGGKIRRGSGGQA